jgi:hypothetical protein
MGMDFERNQSYCALSSLVRSRRSLHPTDEDLSVGTPILHPTDEDLSVGTPILHPTDEDLSVGTPILVAAST